MRVWSAYLSQLESDRPVPFENHSVAWLRARVSVALLGYYWLATAVVVLGSVFTGSNVVAVSLPLCLVGMVAAYDVWRRPEELGTRLLMTVAINSTWMFGLYVVSDVHDGAYMLEVHMLYFINTAVILAYVCWRCVVLTTVAALSHHLILTLLQPELVWPSAEYSWVHLANHSVLGTVNCLAGIAFALAIKRLFNRMERDRLDADKRARIDDLTQVLNRRGLHQSFKKILQASVSGVTLLQIDIDNFKDINDSQGHAFGDDVLTRIASGLLKIAPEGGSVSRIGGDEFVVVLPFAEKVAVSNQVQQLKSFFRLPLEMPHPVRISASIGITDTLVSGDILEEMMIDADIALYEAKKKPVKTAQSNFLRICEHRRGRSRKNLMM